MLILFVLLIFVVFVLVCVLRAWYKLQKYNQQPLGIKTFDGSDSSYHPAVLYFGKGWCGYKYWMSEIPFSSKT